MQTFLVELRAQIPEAITILLYAHLMLLFTWPVFLLLEKWTPVFDVIFGSYFRPRVDEYPPTGLSSGEKIETLWEAQMGPFAGWRRMLRLDRSELT